MRRKFLIFSVCTISLLGVILSFIPFYSSMSPNEKAKASVPRIDISGLENGTYRVVRDLALGAANNNFEWAAFLYKKHNGELKVWHIPVKGAAVGMPDLYWWKPFYECFDFGPTVVDGIVDESLPITCHDEELPSGWWRDRWLWHIDGKELNSSMESLQEVDGEIEGKYFVFVKSR